MATPYLPSSRTRLFRRYLFQLVRGTHETLCVIVADTRNTATFRAAALRVLVGRAPLNVTQGRPFAERRRLVRAFHQL